MAGLVVDYSTRMGKKGGQFGILKVEDYSGSHEFMLFGQNFIDFNKYGIIGTPIMVRGAYQKRYNSEDVRFNVQSISLLDDIKGRVVRNIMISIHDDDLGRAGVINAYMKQNRGSGCDLFFRVLDLEHHRHVDLRSKQRIHVTKQLLELLRENELDFKINVDL